MPSETVNIPLSAVRALSVTMRSNKDVRIKALTMMGADDETIKMIDDIELQIDKVKLKNPEVVAAWGLGCGGVSC